MKTTKNFEEVRYEFLVLVRASYLCTSHLTFCSLIASLILISKSKLTDFLKLLDMSNVLWEVTQLAYDILSD